jgi:3-oxoacyl-[acyl-carrier-protein] synthase-1
MPEDVMVVGVGMVTAVGLTAAETAASVRASIARFTEIEFLDRRSEPFIVAEVAQEGLPPLVDDTAQKPLTGREARLVRLGSAAICGALDSWPAGAVPTPIVLSLPEANGTRYIDPAELVNMLARQCGRDFYLHGVDASLTGRAGGLMAIGRASELIRSGQSGFALAGGIDTYRDLFVLSTLDRERRVKSSTNWDGFIPGEGAAVLLLSSRSAAFAVGTEPLAVLSPVVAGFENGNLYSEQPYRGEGLAAAVGQLLPFAWGPVKDVYSSMNGESHWAKEWGVAFLRNAGAFVPEFGVHHPADCCGDTGAACGPLLVGLAALGLKGGYRSSPALVYGSSDRGHRAAILVGAA